MKKSVCLACILFFMLITIVSCNKKTGFDDPEDNRHPPVFNTEGEAANALSHYFLQAANGEELLRITNILYMESGNKTYALVYYQSSRGNSNILFEKEYQGQTFLAGQHYQCSGSTCDCKVAATIGENGEVSISCSCSGCTMTVSDFVP